MKKYLMFMLAAALFASCSDDDKLPKEEETPGDTNFEEHDGYFVYHGETYKTVKLDNGTTWMAEPLRYVPEGYTPSSDPTADSHIWYPYKLIVEDDNKATADDAEALTDEISIKKLGYFYDMYIALGGKEVTEDNCYEFERVQGICPEDGIFRHVKNCSIFVVFPIKQWTKQETRKMKMPFSMMQTMEEEI